MFIPGKGVKSGKFIGEEVTIPHIFPEKNCVPWPNCCRSYPLNRTLNFIKSLNQNEPLALTAWGGWGGSHQQGMCSIVPWYILFVV
jgi:hypothetical protein